MKLCRGISWCCGRALVLFTSYQGTAATLTISLQVVTLRKSWTKLKQRPKSKSPKNCSCPPKKPHIFGTSLSNILISPTPPEVTWNHSPCNEYFLWWFDESQLTRQTTFPFWPLVWSMAQATNTYTASLESIFTVEPEKTQNFKRIFVFVCWGRGWFEMFYCCQMPKLLS